MLAVHISYNIVEESVVNEPMHPANP